MSMHALNPIVAVYFVQNIRNRCVCADLVSEQSNASQRRSKPKQLNYGRFVDIKTLHRGKILIKKHRNRKRKMVIDCSTVLQVIDFDQAVVDAHAA